VKALAASAYNDVYAGKKRAASGDCAFETGQAALDFLVEAGAAACPLPCAFETTGWSCTENATRSSGCLAEASPSTGGDSPPPATLSRVLVWAVSAAGVIGLISLVTAVVCAWKWRLQPPQIRYTAVPTDTDPEAGIHAGGGSSVAATATTSGTRTSRSAAIGPASISTASSNAQGT
jgi:hypothetical protein